MNRDQERAMQRRQSAKEWAEQQSRGFEPTAVKYPDGYKPLKMEEGALSFDIIPFLAGWGNPRGDEGFLVWERQFSVHRIPRPSGNSDSFVCLWDTFKKPCCVCKKRNQPGLPQEMRDELRPQQRHLILVNDQLDKKLDPPFKLLDTVYYNRKLGFGEQLALTIRSWRGDEDFFDLENGLTVTSQVADTKYKQVSRVDFFTRRYKYNPDLINHVPCLDDCILVPLVRSLKDRLEDKPFSRFLSTFTDKDWALVNDGLQKILDGGDVSDLDVSENGHTTYSLPQQPKVDPPKQEELPVHQPVKKEPVKPTVQSSQPVSYALKDIVKYNGQQMQIIHVSKDGLKLTLEDVDEEWHKVSASDVEKVTAAKQKAADAIQEPEDDDDLDFDDDDD